MRSEGGAERPLGVEFFGVDSLEDSALDIARPALLEAEGGADFSSEADPVVPASDSVDLMLPFLDLLDVPEGGLEAREAVRVRAVSPSLPARELFRLTWSLFLGVAEGPLSEGATDSGLGVSFLTELTADDFRDLTPSLLPETWEATDAFLDALEAATLPLRDEAVDSGFAWLLPDLLEAKESLLEAGGDTPRPLLALAWLALDILRLLPPSSPTWLALEALRLPLPDLAMELFREPDTESLDSETLDLELPGRVSSCFSSSDLATLKGRGDGG